jgi:hypothetical protein
MIMGQGSVRGRVRRRVRMRKKYSEEIGEHKALFSEIGKRMIFKLSCPEMQVILRVPRSIEMKRPP